MTEDLTTPAASFGEPGIVREWDDEQPLSVTVVETVGVLTDRDPATMEPLYGWIDPEALNDLFGGRSVETAAVSVSFRYLDCAVAVSDGFVHVTLDGGYSN